MSDYLVIYRGHKWGIICCVVRANDRYEAVEKMEQAHPYDRKSPPIIQTKLMDAILSIPDDVIELATYLEEQS